MSGFKRYYIDAAGDDWVDATPRSMGGWVRFDEIPEPLKVIAEAPPEVQRALAAMVGSMPSIIKGYDQWRKSLAHEGVAEINAFRALLEGLAITAFCDAARAAKGE